MAGGFGLLWAAAVLVPLAALVVWSLLRVDGIDFVGNPTFEAYDRLFDGGRDTILLRTLRISATVTAIELLIAFPFAFWLAKKVRSRALQVATLGLLTVPFFLSLESRTIVWRSVFGSTGLVNTVLQDLGVVNEPVQWLLFSEFAVHFGLLGPYFPTMVFPIFLAVSMIDDDLLEASRDIGANSWQTLRTIVLPLARPGIVAGILFTFVPMLGETVVPRLMGGGRVDFLQASLEKLLAAFQYPLASALSVVLLGALALALVALRLSGGLGAMFARLER